MHSKICMSVYLSDWKASARIYLWCPSFLLSQPLHWITHTYKECTLFKWQVASFHFLYCESISSYNWGWLVSPEKRTNLLPACQEARSVENDDALYAYMALGSASMTSRLLKNGGLAVGFLVNRGLRVSTYFNELNRTCCSIPDRLQQLKQMVVKHYHYAAPTLAPTPAKKEDSMSLHYTFWNTVIFHLQSVVIHLQGIVSPYKIPSVVH